MKWLSYLSILGCVLGIIDAFRKISMGPAAGHMIALGVIAIFCGAQLYFLIQWVMGEHATALGGTKKTRENLP